MTYAYNNTNSRSSGDAGRRDQLLTSAAIFGGAAAAFGAVAWTAAGGDFRRL